MIKAVIFDMDGTMVDTEKLWQEVNSELAKNYNVVFDEEIQRQMTGRKENEALTLFKEYFHLSVEVEELQQIRKKMLLENLDKVSVNRGLVELLTLLDKLQIKKAIATSAYRDFASAVIKKLQLENRFDTFITGDQVQKGKPNPEIFLTASKELGVSPSEGLVIEDAQNGVEAAFNAGMRVFVVPHENSRNHDFSKATKILDSMLDIDENMLRRL